MVTLEDINAAHARVHSGADFPAYIRALDEMGIGAYTTFVSDGHTMYESDEGNIHSEAREEALAIALEPDREQFVQDLQVHQQGGSGFPTFRQQAAACGIAHWTVSIRDKTCTYYDAAGREVLQEKIPV